jgi:hypothetical protein
LTYEQLEAIENILADLYTDGIGETELNDFFRFEENTLAEWLGFTDFEATSTVLQAL